MIPLTGTYITMRVKLFHNLIAKIHVTIATKY
jgi:hypothetical protein